MKTDIGGGGVYKLYLHTKKRNSNSCASMFQTQMQIVFYGNFDCSVGFTIVTTHASMVVRNERKINLLLSQAASDTWDNISSLHAE
jgi:hypothetical protein